MSRLGIRTAVPALPWKRTQLTTVPNHCDMCKKREPHLTYDRGFWVCKPCKKGVK